MSNDPFNYQKLLIIFLSQYQFRISPENDPPDYSPMPSYRKSFQNHRNRYHATLRMISLALVGLIVVFLVIMGMGVMAITNN